MEGADFTVVESLLAAVVSSFVPWLQANNTTTRQAKNILFIKVVLKF
jgi:hypothetical protein